MDLKVVFLTVTAFSIFSWLSGNENPSLNEVELNQAPSVGQLESGMFKFELIAPDASPEFISADVTKGDNYVVFDMHDPNGERGGHLGILELQIALDTMAESRGEKRPMYVVNYLVESAPGEYSASSDRQHFAFNVPTPDFAKTSTSPIVVFNATSLRYGLDDGIEAPYLGSLMSALAEDNGLGRGGTHRADLANKKLTPYTQITDPDGNTIWGTSWRLYKTKDKHPETGNTPEEIDNYIIAHFERSVELVNEKNRSSSAVNEKSKEEGINVP